MNRGPYIILASQSQARQSMLANAGIVFEALPARIDEESVIEKMLQEGAAKNEIPAALSRAKARHIAAKNVDALVIGSDQILEFEGQVLSKTDTPEMAREKLKMLRGKTHTLTSAVAVVHKDDVLWEYQETATLTMRDFSDEFLDRYCIAAGDALTSCVGAYAIEGLGLQLFEKVEGDHFTILGMPLLSLLHFLDQEQGISL